MSEETEQESGASGGKPTSDDGTRQRIEFYEQYAPKQEVADAIVAYAPILDARLSNLRWMSVISGGAFALVLGFIIAFLDIAERPGHVVAGLLTSAVLFGAAAVLFGVAFLRVTSVKMSLHHYQFSVIMDRLLNQPRLQASQHISGHLDQANRLDGLVAIGLWLFGSGITLAVFTLFVIALT